MIKNYILIIIATLFLNTTLAQVSVKRNLNIALVEHDSAASIKIQNALNGFLTEAQNNQYSEAFTDSAHVKKYEFFFTKLANIGKNSTSFHPPLILKSYPVENGNYRLTVAFTGEKDSVPFVYQITELKAVPFNDHFKFYCVFEDNTKNFKSKAMDNVNFHFSHSFNDIDAQKFVSFTKELSSLTNAPIPQLDYFSFNSLDELLKSYGFLFSARQCNFLCYDLGFTDNEGNTYITGTDNSNYVFGYIGDFLYYNLPNRDDLYWPFVQGLSAYYGGYGLSYDDMTTLKKQFRDKLKENPNINFLDEYKKGNKSTVNNHFSNYVMNAFLFEEALNQKGFKKALTLAYSGSEGERLFENLDTVLNINENNFHETIVKLID